MVKFGSPTFLLRDICKSDLLGVLDNIAGCGFDGLELFGLFGENPKTIRKKCDELNIVIMGDHITYDEFVSETDRVIDEHSILGTNYITIDCIPDDRLPGTDRFSEVAYQIERIGKKCNDAGMRLLYHNQGFDIIDKIGDKHMVEVLLDTVSSEYLSFQPDLGWIAIAGGDPAYFLKKYRDRCPVVHMKDYYATGPVMLRSASVLGEQRGGVEYSSFEFRPTGYGIMRFAELMPNVLECNPEWIVADHDLSYERDTLVDLKNSLDYLRKLYSLYR